MKFVAGRDGRTHGGGPAVRGRVKLFPQTRPTSRIAAIVPYCIAYERFHHD